MCAESRITDKTERILLVVGFGIRLPWEPAVWGGHTIVHIGREPNPFSLEITQIAGGTLVHGGVMYWSAARERDREKGRRPQGTGIAHL